MSNGYTPNQLSATMPRQKIAHSSKSKKWQEQCVEAVCGMSTGRQLNGRSSWSRKQVNYDLVNSIISEDDFQHVLNPYGMAQDKVGAQPAQLQDYNLIANKLNLLKGEEMGRPFNWTVMSTNGEAVIEKDKKKKEMLMFVAQQKLAKELGIPLDQLKPPEGSEEGTPPPVEFSGVDDYARKSMTDVREQWGSDILNYLKHKEGLQLKFNEGWEHALIAAEEVYYIGIVNGEPKARVCNPLNCEFDRNPDNPNVEDGDWFREDRWMTTGQILDDYNEFLTDDQIKKLDTGDIRQSGNNQMFPGFGYSEKDMNQQEYGNGGSGNSNKASSTHHLVSEVCWKSMKKIGFVTYPDESDEEQEGMVDESFVLTTEMKESGYKVVWKWIPEVWKGTKIAESFYVGIMPMPNQARNMDNPSEVKLPYIGRVFNCTNSVQTSIVDLLKPYQYLYNIIWFRLEAEIAKAKGKKMIMDVAQIPKSEGMDMDKWMYYFDNVGIAFINSFEEGKEKFQGQTSGFNQFNAVDMALSQSVGQYINILGKVEQIADKIVGISPQREGGVQQNETVGGVDRAISQSNYVTEPWFYTHNEVKKKVLTQLLETAKFAYPDSKKLHYIVDDVQRIAATIDMEKFCDSDYGIFVTDSSKEHATFQKLEGLAQQALSTGTANLSDIIEVYRATSVSELTNIIRESEENKQQQDAQQAKQQQEMQTQMLQEQRTREDSTREFEAEQNQLDRENDIRKSVITSMGFDQDIQDNGVNDMVQAGNLALGELDSERKNLLEHKKVEATAQSQAKDRSLKQEEIKSKERMNKDNNRTALKNKVSGEK